MTVRQYCVPNGDCAGYAMDAKECDECVDLEARRIVDAQIRRTIANRQKWLARDKAFSEDWLQSGEERPFIYKVDAAGSCCICSSEYVSYRLGARLLCFFCWRAWVNSHRRWWDREVRRLIRLDKQIEEEKKQWRVAKKTMKELTKLVKDPEALRLQRVEYIQAQTSPT